jgi:uncharacterized DUF497 family protein
VDLETLARCQGFEWDEGNATKIWERHRVTQGECEQLFFNRPLVVGEDTAHSKTEPRYFALGETDAGRRLFLAFTVRKNLIRVISARDMNRRERKAYEDAKEDEDHPKIQE